LNATGGESKQSLTNALYQAARETALIASLTSEEYEVRRLVITYCQCNFQDAQLKKLLVYDPCLPMARIAGLNSTVVIDGFTMLHVAASFGSMRVLKMFDELSDKKVSSLVCVMCVGLCMCD
jgi:hypothetical protein